MKEMRKKHDELDRLIKSINDKAMAFTKVVFFEAAIKGVSFNSFEVCFKDSYQWLNVIFVDCSSVNLGFIQKKIDDFGLPMEPRAKTAPNLVHALRTYQGHRMDIENPSDQRILNFRQEWLIEHCGKESPETEEDYKLCLEVLLDDCIAYLKQVDACLDLFAADEHADLIADGWTKLLHRSYSSYEWQMELVEVLNVYGMIHLDTLKIVKNKLTSWREQLHFLKDGFDFKTESRRIIERYIAEEDLWPCNGKDLIDIGVEQKQLNPMIKLAKKMYHEEPCPKEELLERFKKLYM